MKTTSETEPPFLSPLQAAELLGVSRMTVYRLVNRGQVPAVRVGGSIRIPKAPLVSTLQRTRTGPR